MNFKLMKKYDSILVLFCWNNLASLWTASGKGHLFTWDNHNFVTTAGKFLHTEVVTHSGLHLYQFFLLKESVFGP